MTPAVAPRATEHRVILGDARAMPELTDASVQLVVTSPPYWQLKDYGGAGQVGFDDTYEQYIDHLNLVWSECARVLAPGCRMCVNIGDQFARSVYYGRYKVIPIRTEIIRFCETIGLDYMGAVIWQKVTTTHTSGGGAVMGSYPYPRNGILKLDYEFILVFKKPGDGPKVPRDVREASRLTAEEWNTYFAGHWNFPGERQAGHLAMFPEELPRRLIRMFTFVGERVLDPFLGSGTTALAARNLGRDSVGYEVNPEYEPLIRRKLGAEQTGLFSSGSRVQIERRAAPVLDLRERLAALPYRFRDPVRMDKKIDPRTLRFGSKVSRDEPGREEAIRVAAVLSPTRVRLSNGSEVRLIGIDVPAQSAARAEQYLRDATRGTRVFMKYDTVPHDENGMLLCYLYLANKTLLNARLIRQGLAKVDRRQEFRMKERFIHYEREMVPPQIGSAMRAAIFSRVIRP